MARQKKELKRLYEIQQEMADLADEYAEVFKKLEDRCIKEKDSKDLKMVGAIAFAFEGLNSPHERSGQVATIGHEMCVDYLLKRLNKREEEGSSSRLLSLLKAMRGEAQKE